jgi:molecular chaperone GrpE (heat shock protein)
MSDDPLRAMHGLLAAQRRHDETVALLLGFLRLVDGLRALEAHCAELSARGLEHVPTGTVRLLAEQALAALAEADVTPLPAVGRRVDLTVHDVVAVRSDPSAEADVVLEEEQGAYLWAGALLRRARVIVAGPPQRNEPC